MSGMLEYLLVWIFWNKTCAFNLVWLAAVTGCDRSNCRILPLAWISDGGSWHSEKLCDLTVLVSRLPRWVQRGLEGPFGPWKRRARLPARLIPVRVRAAGAWSGGNEGSLPSACNLSNGGKRFGSTWSTRVVMAHNGWQAVAIWLRLMAVRNSG